MDDKKIKKDPSKAELEKLKEELDKNKKETEEYKSKYLRVLADYQNFEKRVHGHKAELKDQLSKDLIIKFLTILDDLDKAEIFIKDPGLKMIKDKFYNLLKQDGVEEIELLGKEFDPYVAEVVDVIEGKQDNIVVEVLRKGYKLNGKVLRVAQVKVSKKGNS